MKAGALLRHSLLHFAVLGLALFLGQNALQGSGILAHPKPLLQLDAATVEQLRRRAEARGIPFEPLLRARIDEEVLIDKALERDLDRRDPVARRRLLQNMRLSYPEAAETELLRRARELDMPRRDVLVRRRLVERMQSEIIDSRVQQAAAGADAPMAERRQTPRLQLEHVFVAGAGDEQRQRAETLRDALAKGQAAPATAGDPHLGGRQLNGVAPADIRRRLGGDVAAAAVRAEPGLWHEPIASVQGWHLLRVASSDMIVQEDTAWAARATQYLAREQSRHRVLAEALAKLRDDYAIRVPDIAAAGAP